MSESLEPPSGDAATNSSLPLAPGVAGVVVLPGLALWRRRPLVAALLFATGVIAPAFALLAVVVQRDDLVGLFTRPTVLRGFALVAIAFITSRAVAVWLTSDHVLEADARRRLRTIGTSIVVLLAVPTTLVVVRMEQTRSVVQQVFQSSPTRGAVTAGTDVDPTGSQYRTVLMMGSDEGADRVGLRTDSMILAMVHQSTGHTVLVSVPRNLAKVHFPPGTAMAQRYPNGFTDLANAIYITVQNDAALRAAYSGSGMAPGIRALMEGLSYSLGVSIDDYVLVNSCAFVKVVDAIGGVTITLDKSLPMPSKLRCSNYRLPATIGPGPVFMDGTKALGYVRSRTADSDYYRMERQRILLQTIARSVGIGTLLKDFGSLADAVKSDVRTSMTVDEARSLLSQLQADHGTFQSIGLVPPIVTPGRPDYPALRRYIQDLRRRVAAGETVTVTTDGA